MTSAVLNSKEPPQKLQQTAQNFFLKRPQYAVRKNAADYKTKGELLEWYCQVCGLMLTSKIQAEEHFFGKRHQNLVRSKASFDEFPGMKIIDLSTVNKKDLVFDRLQSPSKSSFNQNFGSGCGIQDPNDIIPPPAGRDNILETVLRSERKTFYSSDLSIYRTPSGKYYCQPCNITVNSQAQFLQHSESRKHKHKTSRASLKVKKSRSPPFVPWRPLSCVSELRKN